MDKDKGQKIIAALYLATNHISDTDPMKHSIRTLALKLAHPELHVSAAKSLTMIIGAAVIAKLLSEKNASIINFELHKFIAPAGATTEDEIAELFTQPFVMSQKNSSPHLSYKSPKKQSDILPAPKLQQPKESGESKNKRHEAILSFINTRKSAAIKDIASLFPELSEKTIQRELGALVSDGKITKRGSKRWSIYMAVGA